MDAMNMAEITDAAGRTVDFLLEADARRVASRIRAMRQLMDAPLDDRNADGTVLLSRKRRRLLSAHLQGTFDLLAVCLQDTPPTPEMRRLLAALDAGARIFRAAEAALTTESP